MQKAVWIYRTIERWKYPRKKQINIVSQMERVRDKEGEEDIQPQECIESNPMIFLFETKTMIGSESINNVVQLRTGRRKLL